MSIDLTPNVIGRWKLNEVDGTIVNDSIGDHNGTTVVNISTITNSSSPNGRSSSFFINGDSDKVINAGDHEDFTFGDGTNDSPFSFSVWGKISTSNNGTFIAKSDNSSNREYSITKSGNNTIVALFDEVNNGIVLKLFDISYADLEWHFLAWSYDGRGGNSANGGIRFYIDGIEIFGIDIPLNSYTSMNDTGSDLIIGDNTSLGHTFDGYMVDAMLFDRVLTDGEVRYLYNDGFGVDDLAISDPISSPTLTFPNGGEIFTEGSINIQWIEPGNLLTTELTWYEIFITDDFNKTKKEELIQIATIPSGKTTYSYSIQKNLRGKKSRIGIRSVNNRGLRSNISFSADDFTIINEGLPSPVLIEPVMGGTYFSYISFVFDHNGVLGRSSQRAFYQIYYKSDKQNIDWTLLQNNIMVGTDPVTVDVSNFNTNSDYVFKIELVDGDNISAPVFIDEVNINNINLFLIDTTPPIGNIKIINNKEFTKNNSLVLKISASDDTTAVKDVQIQQTNILTGETNDLEKSPFVPLTPLLTWDIKPEGTNADIVDGVKLIQARFRDYGGNVLQFGNKKYFRTYKNLSNRKVTAFLYDGTDLYYTFASNSTTGSLAELHKNLTFVSTLTGDATSLEVYNDILYIAIKDDENKGILQKLTGESVSTISDNNSQFLDVAETIVNSLFFADSVINAMEVFENTLFLGLDNGTILSFEGVSVSLENESFLNLKSVKNIKTDGILLYIFFHNTTEILIMNKNNSGNYVFSSVDTES